jgi:hypothetical protein
MVYIRSLKIQNKLKQDAHGPYTVVGRTANGNYCLENRLGKRMQQAYPLSRLKEVTPEPSEENYEVEKIIDHRIRHGHFEYFVKWKGYAVSECSWVKERNFDTTEIIEEYWETQTKPMPTVISPYVKNHPAKSQIPELVGRPV